MYNAFVVHKKQIELGDLKKKSQTNRKYVKKYYDVVRPVLIDNHNKRINSFIRRMEQQPLQINLDPHVKNQTVEINSSMLRKSEKRSSSYQTGRRGYSSMNYDQQPHLQTFKFKDNQDWKSLFTPAERIERQRNYQLFKQKYGDPTIAYRSIGSQSEYKPFHQFRGRDKEMQINPPMKYTNKPTQQILANLKSKYKNKQKNKQSHEQIKNNGNLPEQKQQQVLLRRNTSSSISGINQQNILGDNMTDREKTSRDENTGEKQFQISKRKQRQENKSIKLHFKQIMDLEQNIQDVKTKKALRQILYKCGVYRRKNRRVATDSEVDQLSQFTDARQY